MCSVTELVVVFKVFKQSFAKCGITICFTKFQGKNREVGLVPRQDFPILTPRQAHSLSYTL